jgi:hypothetical protein
MTTDIGRVVRQGDRAVVCLVTVAPVLDSNLPAATAAALV